MRNFLLITGLLFLWMIMVAGFLILERLFAIPSVNRGDVKSLNNYLITSLTQAAEQKRLGCAALILIHQGNVVATRTFGTTSQSTGARPLPEETLFLLCSVSKAVTAWGVLKLVQDGNIGLDEPILPHLKQWDFPGSEKYRSEVTIRHLLTHTSGLNDGFGYSGFPLDEPKQTAVESLTYPRDANNGTPHPAVIFTKPGTTFIYASSSYTILQILIEDVTGKSFNQYMKDDVLKPLGMSSTTYEIEDVIATGRQAHLAPNYDAHLAIQPHRKHTMMAGGSLRATANDFARFISAYFNNHFLNSELIKEMGQAQHGTNGKWGLGHEIYGQDKSNNNIFGHGGGAFPRTGASFRINPATGNGLALFMTGGSEMIDPYMNVWQYWETGEVTFDIRDVIHARIIHALIAFTLGALFIIGFRKRIIRISSKHKSGTV